jgi:hypothetical protein
MTSSVNVGCPYCGEIVTVVLDEGGGASQRYVEDCEVCCRPIQLSVRRSSDGHYEVDTRREDDPI